MALDSRDILFASLVGSKVAETLPRLQAVENILGKTVAPPFNLLPLQSRDAKVPASNVSVDGTVWMADAPKAESDQFFPLTMVSPSGVRYLLPYEPLISINGRNKITRRHVAKMKPQGKKPFGGTIKERWTQDDYEITITGFLMNQIMTGRSADCFPKDDFTFLKDIITSGEAIRVFCEPLQLLGIDYIVVEDFSFPFTKGENVQAYDIKAYSDFDYKLLLDIND